MIEQLYSHAKYQIILFRYVLDKHRKIGYISKISDIFDIFDFLEKIMIFSIPAHMRRYFFKHSSQATHG